MNAIRQTALLNKRELENATPPSASWHADYRDTAWIYIGGIPLDLSEGDVVVVFSQFGNPTHLNLIRDKDTGKTKGFGFLKYEDQRSCDLAVDNLGGAELLGRMLRVDHTRYKKKENEDEETYRIELREKEMQGGEAKQASDTEASEDESRNKKKRRKLKEEKELEEMLAITADGEEQDPMRDYLIQEKREEVERAKEREKEKRHAHRHRHRHRHTGDDGDDGERHRRRRRHRDREERSEMDHEIREDALSDTRSRHGEPTRRRSRSRDGYRKEQKRRDSLSPQKDHVRRQRGYDSRSRSPKRRSKYDDD